MNPQDRDNDAAEGAEGTAADRAVGSVASAAASQDVPRSSQPKSGEQAANEPTPRSQRFIAHFYRANRALHETMGARLQADHGLEMREFMVLSSIHNGYHYSTGIARRLYANKYAVSRVVQKLLDAGLIRRAIDEGDSRKVRLDTTEQGVELRKRALASMNDSVMPLLADLGEEASEKLILGLEKMIEQLQEPAESAPGDEE